MKHGYSSRVIKLNQAADVTSIGVKLGRMCIEYDVPVTTIAEKLGVTRQTVYNWFCATHKPSTKQSTALEELLLDFT